jgi:hypothetical protein
MAASLPSETMLAYSQSLERFADIIKFISLWRVACRGGGVANGTASQAFDHSIDVHPAKPDNR